MPGRQLSRAIGERGWDDGAAQQFNRILDYKDQWYGKKIVRIARFVPTVPKPASSVVGIIKDLKLVARPVKKKAVIFSLDSNSPLRLNGRQVRSSRPICRKLL